MIYNTSDIFQSCGKECFKYGRRGNYGDLSEVERLLDEENVDVDLVDEETSQVK